MQRVVTLLLILLAFGFSYARAKADHEIEVAFSPRGGATQTMVKLIGEARGSIRVAAYRLTSTEIAAALAAAHNRGIDVKVVLDKSDYAERYSAAKFLTNGGVPIRIDDQYAIMHNKFLVVDDVTVETGSFNYTRAAEDQNAENLLILRNEPEIARQYLARWHQLWDESREYQVRD